MACFTIGNHDSELSETKISELGFSIWSLSAKTIIQRLKKTKIDEDDYCKMFNFSQRYMISKNVNT
jgi:hypothetical protein